MISAARSTHDIQLSPNRRQSIRSPQIDAWFARAPPGALGCRSTIAVGLQIASSRRVLHRCWGATRRKTRQETGLLRWGHRSTRQAMARATRSRRRRAVTARSSAIDLLWSLVLVELHKTFDALCFELLTEQSFVPGRRSERNRQRSARYQQHIVLMGSPDLA